MKHTVQVIYPRFTEVYDVELKPNHLKIDLNSIRTSPHSRKIALTLDFKNNSEELYAQFPLQDNDLLITQEQNSFLVLNLINGKVEYVRFTPQVLIDFLLGNDLIQKLLPFFSEDKQILLNSLLSDIIHNDYSYNELNKSIKFLKCSALLAYIATADNFEFKRIVMDETLLGDIDIEHVVLACRFVRNVELELSKINNVHKVLHVLQREGIVAHELELETSMVFINNTKGKSKTKLYLKFADSETNFTIEPEKNYMFDLGQKEYELSINQCKKSKVKGKVVVYNGDERDLMID